MNLTYFNLDGSLKEQFTFSDPYRRGDNNEAVTNPNNKNDLAIHGFDEDGNVFAFLSDEVTFIVRQKECHASSLAAEIYYAYIFSCSKGCPPACYYWR